MQGGRQRRGTRERQPRNLFTPTTRLFHKRAAVAERVQAVAPGLGTDNGKMNTIPPPVWDTPNLRVLPNSETFPPVIDHKRLHECMNSYVEQFSEDCTDRMVCAVCGLVALPSRVPLYKQKWDAGFQRKIQHVFAKVEGDHLPEWKHAVGYEKNGFLLEYEGVTESSEGAIESIIICGTCNRDIAAGKLPVMALMNGTWVEDDDFEAGSLNDLSYLEQQLIAKVIVRSLVVSLRGRCAPAQRCYALKGNIINFPVDHEGVQAAMAATAQLPRNLGETIEHFAVEFYGNFPKKTIAHIKSVRDLFLVRKDKVRSALAALTRHHRGYKTDQASEQALLQLPECAIPESLWGIVGENSSKQGVEVDRDRSGYATADVLQGAPTSASQSTSTTPIFHDQGVRQAGLIDTNGTLISEDALMQSCLEKMLRNKQDTDTPSLRVGVGNMPMNEYTNPHMGSYAFPHLFKLGVGAPTLSHEGGPGIARAIPYKAHVRHLLSRKHRRFARSKVYGFWEMNRMQRQKIMQSARAVMRTEQFQTDAVQMATITPQQVQRVVDGLAAGRSLPELTDEASPALKQLLSHMRVVGGQIPFSYHAKSRLKRQLQARIHTLGPFLLFCTINPNDWTNRLVMKWATGYQREPYGDPLYMEYIDTLRVVAENPDASALAFDYIVRSFFETLVCAGSKSGGILGHVTAYSGYPETQHRAQWHIHITKWVKDAGTAAGIVELLRANTDGFLERLRGYVDKIICACSIAPPCGVASGTTSSEDTPNGTSVPPRCEVSGCPSPSEATTNAPAVALPTHGENCPKRRSRRQADEAESTDGDSRKRKASAVEEDNDMDEHKPPEWWKAHFEGSDIAQYFNAVRHPLKLSARLPPLFPNPKIYSPEAWHEALAIEADSIAQEVNHHVCTFTCFKNGRRTCRGGAPWELEGITTIDPETGIIRLKRNDPFLNGYNRACITVTRCNMDLKYVQLLINGVAVGLTDTY